MGFAKGDYARCHPNNHVNLSQSTNDVYPTALRLVLVASTRKLVAVLEQLIAAFRAKGKEFAGVVKMGRTQLQDAVPMTLGQEFEAYAVTLGEEVDRLDENAALVIFSSTVKRLAVKLSKIANDLRLLSSGPGAGLHEINLPKMQPGSSSTSSSRSSPRASSNRSRC